MERPRLFCFVKLLFSMIFLLSVSATMAAGEQDGITGKVLDDQGSGVAGATVLVKDTTLGTITSATGEFFIPIKEDQVVLQISFLGYDSVELNARRGEAVEVTITSSNIQLNDVVVVAYGSQKKATLTGAISAVGTDELLVTPVSDVTNILAGKMPGVTTIQTTGQPGKDQAQIYIRGVGSLSSSSSSPLILVDGVERSFSEVDPNEIENLSILKDASSTAVFGVRGANGVILVTTRRGKTGAPSISFSTTMGIQQPMSYVKQTGSYEYAKFWNQKQLNDGLTESETPGAFFTKEAIEMYYTGADPMMYPDKQWGEEVYRDAFFQTQNNINISGGSDDVKYFVSMGYTYKNGLLREMETLDYDNNFSYNRYNFRSNLDFKLSPTTQMKFNIGGNIGITQQPHAIEDISHAWTVVNIWSVPMAGPGIVDGVRTLVQPNLIPSEVATQRDGYFVFYGFGYEQEYRTALNMDAEITQDLSAITEGLSVSAKGAYDNIFRRTKERVRDHSGLESQYVYYQSNLDNSGLSMTHPDFDRTHVYVPYGTNAPLGYSESYGRDRNWYLDFRVNYNRTFNEDHDVTALLLYTQSRNYYPDLAYSYIPRSYSGLVGRVTYGYKSKYLAEINMGYNGSENFAPGSTRYGLFPAFSVGYVLTEEDFMKNQDVLTYFKLRASVGKVGSDAGQSSRFMYMDSVWNTNGNYWFGQNNPTSISGYVSGTPGNSLVTWETSTKYNLGLDMNLFDSRLSFTGDVFYEYRSDILIAPNSTPSIIATSLPDLNIGEVENYGYEVMLGWGETLSNGFRYDLSANVSFARNKIIYMDEVKKNYDYQQSTGGSVGRYSDLYKFDRIYQESDFVFVDGEQKLNPELPQPMVTVYPGDAMYADLNGDNIIDTEDRMTTGYSNRPEFVFGFNSIFEYKGFNVSMQWTGATNVNKMMQVEYRIPFTNAGNRGLLDYFVDDCWSPTNQSGTLPRAAEVSEGWNSEASTLWLRDATYVRLKTMSVGYTFKNSSALKKVGISSLGIKVSGYNLLTFSGLDFEDPETVASNEGEYPLIKSYDIGINLKF